MKKIKPKNYEFIMLHILMLLPLLFCVLGLIYDFNELKYIVFFTGIVYMIFGYIPQIINFSSIYIQFESNYIFVPNQLVYKLHRTQFQEKINFDEINKIEIISSINNSSNKPIKKIGYGNLKIKKYIQFTLSNGEKKWIWIDYYTKKQIYMMLYYLKLHIDINIEEIIKNWFGSYAEYKKLNKK